MIVFALIIPKLVHQQFWMYLIVEQIAVWILLALGLNVVVGFAGLLDLGFAPSTRSAPTRPPGSRGPCRPPRRSTIHFDPLVHPVAIGFAMPSGVILGMPTLRLRGDYLAIVTLGFGEIITIFANNLYGITGGSLGSMTRSRTPCCTSGPIHYTWGLAPVPYYYLILTFIVLFLIGYSLLEHSRVGRAWTAIREDEVAAESVGINPLKYKVMAFAIGAATAGFAGVVTAGQSNVIFTGASPCSCRSTSWCW